MEWRGRRSLRRRTRKRLPAPQFEWLEDRVAPAVAADVDLALPELLVDEQPEAPAEIWSEEAPGDEFLVDQSVEISSDSSVAFDDFSYTQNDPVDALAFATLDTSSPDAVDHVFTTAANDHGEDALIDPAEDFRELAALAPAILEAVFPRPEATPLPPELGRQTFTTPVANRAPLPPTVSATTEAFALDSALYGVGGSIDETGQGDWHTSRLQDAVPTGADPMAPASAPMREPMPQPMSDARKSESAASVLAPAQPDIDEDKADPGVVVLAGPTGSRESPVVAAPASPSLVSARGSFTAALLLWWLLLVAQFRVMRLSRPAPCEVVRQGLRAVMRPPDPIHRREQRKADASVCLFCCAVRSNVAEFAKIPPFASTPRFRNSCEFRYGHRIACPVCRAPVRVAHRPWERYTAASRKHDHRGTHDAEIAVRSDPGRRAAHARAGGCRGPGDDRLARRTLRSEPRPAAKPGRLSPRGAAALSQSAVDQPVRPSLVLPASARRRLPTRRHGTFRLALAGDSPGPLRCNGVYPGLGNGQRAATP
jgi:hypothetical protein